MAPGQNSNAQRNVKWVEVRHLHDCNDKSIDVTPTLTYLTGPSRHRVAPGCHIALKQSLCALPGVSSRVRRQSRLHLPLPYPSRLRNWLALGLPLLPPHRLCQCHGSPLQGPRRQSSGSVDEPCIFNISTSLPSRPSHYNSRLLCLVPLPTRLLCSGSPL